jgi:hypothetical protein
MSILDGTISRRIAYRFSWKMPPNTCNLLPSVRNFWTLARWYVLICVPSVSANRMRLETSCRIYTYVSSSVYLNRSALLEPVRVGSRKPSYNSIQLAAAKQLSNSLLVVLFLAWFSCKSIRKIHGTAVSLICNNYSVSTHPPPKNEYKQWTTDITMWQPVGELNVHIFYEY